MEAKLTDRNDRAKESGQIKTNLHMLARTDGHYLTIALT